MMKLKYIYIYIHIYIYIYIYIYHVIETINCLGLFIFLFDFFSGLWKEYGFSNIVHENP